MSKSSWLEYGSQDSSVILQHPLTSDPSAYFATLGTTTVSGSGLQTFDPVKGMCPNGSGGFRIQSMSRYLELDNGGQITFEVEREFLCLNNPSNYTFGQPFATDEFALTMTPTTGTSWYIKKKVTTGECSYSTLASSGNTYICSAGKGQFVKVCLGWVGGRVGGKYYVAIDDTVVKELSTNDATAVGVLANFYIGGDSGLADRYMTLHHIRNLQISSKPPSFQVHPILRNIGMISDSMNNTNIISSTYGDIVTSWSMRRSLNKHGLDVGTVTWSNEGGSKLDDSVDGGITDYIYTQLGPCLATRPTIVVIRGGTNDVSGGRCSQPSWQGFIDLYINACMAQPSVKAVFFLGIPSGVADYEKNTNTWRTERTLGDTKIKAACDAWRAANPTDPRQLVFVDIYNTLGGETPAAGTFIGQVNGLSDDQHFSGYGHYLHGNAIADAIRKVIA